MNEKNLIGDDDRLDQKLDPLKQQILDEMLSNIEIFEKNKYHYLHDGLIRLIQENGINEAWGILKKEFTKAKVISFPEIHKSTGHNKSIEDCGCPMAVSYRKNK